jgi:hypothetical protein
MVGINIILHNIDKKELIKQNTSLKQDDNTTNKKKHDDFE